MDPRTQTDPFTPTHLSISLFDGEPLIGDEDKFLLGLQVLYDDVTEIPRGVLAGTRVVMPDTHVVEGAERPARNRASRPMDRLSLFAVMRHVISISLFTVFRQAFWTNKLQLISFADYGKHLQ